MTAIDELLERRSQDPHPFGTVPPATNAEPAMRVCVLTCMDTRIDVPGVFRLRPGEAHILRNGGGVVTDDVIRSVALSQRHLGTTELLIMGHTTCGLSTITDEGFKDELEADTGQRPDWPVEAFDDVHASVRRSVERARGNPFLPHRDGVRGFVYDIDTGDVTEIS